MLKPTILTTISLLFFTPTALAQTARIHTISGSGKVTIQRANRTDWLPARKGTSLNADDQIFPDRTVKVLIRCSDRTQPVRVRAGVVSGLGSICPRSVTRDARGSQATETIGGLDPTIPYLITPRHTLLLSATPLIRWNPVAGASEYQVEVNSPTGSVWKIKTPTPQLVYAGPRLQPGIPYTVTIRTNTGKSSHSDRRPDKAQATTALDFRILRPTEAKAIQTEAAQITTQPPNNVADALTLAEFYGDYVLPKAVASSYQLSDTTFETYSLTSDAIAVLEALPSTDQQSTHVQLALANLYWQIGVARQAELHYQQAINQVQGLEDLENWTQAQYGLGQLYAAINDPEKARLAYQQAQSGYRFLGDMRRADLVNRKIEALDKTRKQPTKPAS